KYTVGDTGISYRMINYWSENGVLPDGIQDGSGWKRFSLIELVWLRVVQKLRGFGLPFPNISRTLKCIMDWDKKLDEYPMFEFYSTLARASKLDPYVVVLPNGLADLATSEELELSKKLSGNSSMIFISLKDVLHSMNIKTAKPEVLYGLTDPEFQLLFSVRSRDVKEVSAKMKEGNIKELEKTKIYSNDVSPYEMEKELNRNSSFGRIEIKHDHGKRQESVLKTKERFK
ncbi:MAG: MerR family transcriptional regulator, partial [archaeon]